MAKTFEELAAGADKIRKNELPESNTHQLVGGQLIDIIEKQKALKEEALSQSFIANSTVDKTKLNALIIPGTYSFIDNVGYVIDDVAYKSGHVEVFKYDSSYLQTLSVLSGGGYKKFYRLSNGATFSDNWKTDCNKAGGYVGLDASRHINQEVIPLDYRRTFGYRFDGTSSLDVPSNDKILFGENDYSIEVYFKPLVVNALNWIMLKLEPKAYWGIFVREDGLVGINTVKDQYVQAVATKNKLVAGNWYHLVVTRKRNQQFVYLDGVCETVAGELMTLNVDNTQLLHIGGQNGYGKFIGDIGLIRFYNYSLEQVDIEYYYNGGRPDLSKLRFEDVIDTYEELISDTQFNMPSMWTLARGWSISDGKLIATNVLDSYVAQWGIKIKWGKKYNIKCDCNNDLTELGISGGTQVIKINKGNYNIKINEAPNGAVVVHGNYSIPYSDSIDNFSVRQIGCTMEFLPENANKTRWSETQNSLHALTIGGTTVNIEIPETERLLIDTISANITEGISNKDIALPTGYFIEKITVIPKGDILNIKILNINTREVYIEKAWANLFPRVFSIINPLCVLNAPTSIRINADGISSTNPMSIKINIKRVV